MQRQVDVGIPVLANIRRAKTSECSLISAIALRAKAYWGYDDAFMRACRGELTYNAGDFAATAYYVICARDNAAQVVGFYGLTEIAEACGAEGDQPRQRDSNQGGFHHVNGLCELDAMFVEPAEIGEGYGRALIEHAKTTARRAGASTLIIQSDPNAVGFYVHCGAIRIGERESDSIAGRQLPLLSIAL